MSRDWVFNFKSLWFFEKFADRSIGDYYTKLTCRILIYLIMLILSGLLTFLALNVYTAINPVNKSSLLFQGIYAWMTALNFGICHFLVDLFCGRFTGKWGRFEERTLLKTLTIWFAGYILFFIIERTIIWKISIHNFLWKVSLYYIPPGVDLDKWFASIRPTHLESFLFCLPFWIIIVFITLSIILKMQGFIGTPNTEKITDKIKEIGNKDKKVDKSFKYPQIIFQNSNGTTSLHPDQISHISAEDHYLRIYTIEKTETNPVFVKMSLKSIISKIPENLFLQVHRSHIINKSFIKKLKKDKSSYSLFLTDNETVLPVSRHRISELKPFLSEYL